MSPRRHSIPFFAILLAPLAAAQGTGGNSASTSASVGAQPHDSVRFVDGTAAAGLSGLLVVGNGHTAGNAWVDYNGDLLPDLFITNGGGAQHWLFRNDGDGTFTNVSNLVLKPDVSVEDASVNYADIDNDGDDDILVAVDNPADVVISQPVNPREGGPNLLYRNNGNGTFTEVAASYGIVHPLGYRTIAASFGDWDVDGNVDLYLVSWTPYGLPLGVNDDFDRLLHNDGDGTFTDVTATYGVDGAGLDGLGALWFDPNFDLFPDLYVANTAFTNSPPAFIPIDNFYKNTAGTAFADIQQNLSGFGDDSWASMGIDIADIENDGDWDLYVTDVFFNPPNPLGNPLYIGLPNGGFLDNQADDFGVQAQSSWPCDFADLNLDGWVDLWVATNDNGGPDFFYINEIPTTGKFKTLHFDNLPLLDSQGGSMADFDGDGDVDFCNVPDNQDFFLYRNDSDVSGKFLQLKLYGQTSNKGAIGAVVRVTAGGITQMRRVTGGDSAHSQSEAIVHFGVANHANVMVSVTWPNGQVDVFNNVPTQDLVLIDEDQGILPESLTTGGATFDPVAHTLTVSARTTYGGRTQLSVPGLGALRYDAESCLHMATFTDVQAAPSRVVVQAERGGRFPLKVASTARR